MMDRRNIAAALALAGLSFGCSERVPPAPAISSEDARLARIDKGILQIVNHGEGVYEFSSESFGEVLATFKKRHPELIITAITQGPDKEVNPDGNRDPRSRYAISDTFIVNTEKR